MQRTPSNAYLITSICAHVLLLLVMMLSVYFAAPLPVFENTNKNDVISAVVLGDVAKSKILPQKVTPIPTPPPESVKMAEAPKPEPVKLPAKKEVQPVVKKEVIVLEKIKPKKIVKKMKMPPVDIDNLLADIKKEVTQKKVKNEKTKQVAKVDFKKLLQAQAEKTLRENLLDEEIRIEGERTRQAQGEVNKFKALIIQSISEHWIIPLQSNKKLVSELMIRLSPGGTVLDVQVTKSSGDPALDSSARAAVLKSSPLPVPKDPEAFKAFKQFVLKVKPENIL